VQKAQQIINAVSANPQGGEEAKKIPPQDAQLARLAALLHDVGNLPFGHTLEDETCVILENQDDLDRFQHFIGKSTDIGRILLNEIGEEGYQSLLTILTTKQENIPSLGDRAYVCDIVKNTICADLLDYLERDAFHCNLKISIGDRFLRYLFVARADGARRLAVRLWKEKDERPRPDILSELVFLLEASVLSRK
jgi:HD superfamily phosphohydrolase